MADIKISELTRVASLNNGDLVEVSQVNELAPSGYTSLSASMTDIGAKVNTDIEYTTDLADFTDKTIVGAINENKDNLEGMTASTLPLTTGSQTTTAEAINSNATAITALQTGKSNLLKTVRKWQDVSFDNYYKSFTMNVAETGYTPIGICGFQTNTVGAQFFRLNFDTTDRNSLYVGLVARDGTSTISGTISIYIDILYVKN